MKTLILSGYGTNCEKETAHACRLAGGGEVEVAHMSRLYEGSLNLDGVGFLVFMGGFLDGDDLGSGRACANRFRFRPLPGGGTFLEALQGFVASGRLVLGICNGFQLLVKMGLLPGEPQDKGAQTVTLAPNANGRFEDRWVRLKANPASPAIFTRGLEYIELPIRHGEGRLAGGHPQALAGLAAKGLVPLQYTGASGQPSEEYPANPNGSPLGAAALCNPTGTVMGLMPHPEAFHHYTNHPRWTRRPKGGEGEGLLLFKNAYLHLKTL